MRCFWLTMVLGACHRGAATPDDKSEEDCDSNHQLDDSGDSGDTGKVPGDAYADALRVGVIGDYGLAGENEAAVAEVVAGMQADFVITTGDNNYFSGSAESIDTNIGQYYHSWISPYVGSFGEGAGENRFFPSLGNHDWYTDDAQPYLDYFELPGNERYYDFTWEDAHFFCVDSDPHEPDGNSANSVQGQWLKDALAGSTAPWKIVYFHHAPYSSGTHESTSDMQWPFREWGADLVLSGHDHDYERVVVDGLPYVVTGTGGGDLREFSPDQAEGTQVGLDMVFGAVLMEITAERLRLSFHTVGGAWYDQVDLVKGERFDDTRSLVAGGADWRYLDDGVGADGWEEPGFDDSAWARGPAPLGYGDDDIATEVSFGGDSGNKHITTWFRRSFELPGPAGVRALQVSLRRDDGAMVYLNGHLVLRSNMPDGTVTVDTTATTGVSGDEERTWHSASINPALLEGGTNVLAVEVHQAEASSSDLALDLELTATVGQALLSSGDTWQYLDTGAEPAEGWSGLDFDASDWATGPSPLGFGQGDEATTVQYGDPKNKYTTSWFRSEFKVDDPSGYGALRLRLVRDDGAIVYLNGRGGLRPDLPAGEVFSSSPNASPLISYSSLKCPPHDSFLSRASIIMSSPSSKKSAIRRAFSSSALSWFSVPTTFTSFQNSSRSF